MSEMKLIQLRFHDIKSLARTVSAVIASDRAVPVCQAAPTSGTLKFQAQTDLRLTGRR